MRRSVITVLGLAVALCALPAAAQETNPPAVAFPPPPRVSMVTAPVWARTPSPEYPELALDLGIEARVRVECVLDRTTGGLSACQVLEESIPGMGFGRRAAAAAHRARARVPAPSDGEPRLGRARFNLLFLMPYDAEETAPSWRGPAPEPEALDEARAVIAGRQSLPADLFIAGLGPQWAAQRDQVNREFDAEAREVWALALARASRGGRAGVLREETSSYTPRLEDWGHRQPEAWALQRRMKARLRALMCEGRTCTLPRRATAG